MENDLDYNAKDRSVVKENRAWVPRRCEPVETIATRKAAGALARGGKGEGGGVGASWCPTSARTVPEKEILWRPFVPSNVFEHFSTPQNRPCIWVVVATLS